MFKFMQFLLKVDKSIKKHLSPWWKGKGCHDNDNETVPRQRSSSGNSIEVPMQRRSVRMRAKDGGALPDTGCPMNRRRCQMREQLTFTGGLRQPTCIRSRTSSRGYTFEACMRDSSRSVQSRGSRHSRDGCSGSSRSRTL